VLPRLDPQPLELTVEIVHDSRVIAVDEHLGLTWLDLEAQIRRRVVAAVAGYGFGYPIGYPYPPFGLQRLVRFSVLRWLPQHSFHV
jgi:hypothetical protein